MAAASWKTKQRHTLNLPTGVATLTDQEEALLCRLSVFVNGWTLEAARVVGACPDIEESEVLDLLTSLTDKSLVLMKERGDTARYRLLDTVQQYGRDRPSESGESLGVRTRHRDYYLAFAEVAEPKLVGADQAEWLE